MTPDELCRRVWTNEPAPKDEGRKTTGGDGWNSWNGKAPEAEFCEFAGALVRLLHPARIIETGMGGGFTTRRVLKAMGDGGWDARFDGYEADDEFREATRRHAWNGLIVADEPTPTRDDVAAADLLILDSASPWRNQEFRQWVTLGKPGSYCLMHDVDPTRDPGTVQHSMGRLVEGVTPGILLGNPRGGWLGRHP